ncbi:MAG: DUF4349 domain-containing protein, partial [Fibromonadales bacterium]|nr:DUF4349 domain-containing protein [Fibromonadales bacterium]
MVTYTVRLSIAVKSIDPAKTAIIEQMKNYKGFIVVETGNSITMRIPAENMDSFISTAKTLGETESENKIGKDITDQYRDDVIRLNNLKKVRDRYLELLEQADAVGDILNIEKELERVNTQIEQLEGRKKYAEESVALSDITIRFYEKVRLGPLGWVFYGVYLGIAWLFVWD